MLRRAAKVLPTRSLVKERAAGAGDSREWLEWEYTTRARGADMTERTPAVELRRLDEGLVELRLDKKTDAVNALDTATRRELGRAIAGLAAESGLRGILITSGKDVFVAGADVKEFVSLFHESEEAIARFMLEMDTVFSALEDLEAPSVAAINGVALGGGFELCLAASYRVMAETTKVGLPETKLGIFPGWGGTVRLSRLCGADTAIEWIAGGEHWGAAQALKAGAVDAVVAPSDLREAALRTLREAATGRLDWRARRQEKKSPLSLDAVETGMVFAVAKALVAGKAGPHYPAPLAAVQAIEAGAARGRDEALSIEANACARLAKTETARALVSVFLGEQAVKRITRQHAQAARPVRRAAVLGAGIMGGGIAYQSATRGVPVLMKDVAAPALTAGQAETARLLEKQIERGKLTSSQLAATLAAITPTLSYGDFAGVDFVVEAVVENEAVKKQVLAEVERIVAPEAVLASNTSTISITRLAQALSHPERFCGLHFFNPVHRMPLVEVIRGARTSAETIATAVGYAQALGKTPIVVEDCPGFLVNRVLFPYFAGFLGLVRDGVDYERVDRVLEAWGWPMGPARLLDVVGIDTAVHAARVLAEAFPDRMARQGESAIESLLAADRRGQKNGKGFYLWKSDKKGAPGHEGDPVARALVGGGAAAREVADEEIVERAMLPMLLEASRCLEERIVATPVEVDVALVNGLGFPPFRGGIFRWADALGAPALLRAAERHRSRGALFAPTAQLSALAASGQGFHGESGR
jgi:3-hydroxyacyl-CoA dehydrogenase / enoyl-CoA hydratase / 3-hydroxybutyryl-CoA epimerase / enoyl-CoA isomerase